MISKKCKLRLTGLNFLMLLTSRCLNPIDPMYWVPVTSVTLYRLLWAEGFLCFVMDFICTRGSSSRFRNVLVCLASHSLYIQNIMTKIIIHYLYHITTSYHHSLSLFSLILFLFLMLRLLLLFLLKVLLIFALTYTSLSRAPQ